MSKEFWTPPPRRPPPYQGLSPQSSGSPQSPQLSRMPGYGYGHNPTEVKLCSIVDAAFDKIQELQDLLQREEKLTGVKTGDAILGPILRKQEELMTKIERIQIDKRQRIVRQLASNDGLMSTSTLPNHPWISLRGDDAKALRRTQPDPLPPPIPAHLNALNRNHSMGDMRRDRSRSRSPSTRATLELKPDEKYTTISGSSFQIGLPHVTELPTSSLKPIQAQLVSPRPLIRPATFSYQHNFPYQSSPLESPRSEQSVPRQILSSVSLSDELNGLGGRSVLGSRNNSNVKLTFPSATSDYYRTMEDFPSEPSSRNASNSSILDISNISSVGELPSFNSEGDSMSDLSKGLVSLNLGEVDANANVRKESSKPFEMADFYKYSEKWKRFMDSTTQLPKVLKPTTGTGNFNSGGHGTSDSSSSQFSNGAYARGMHNSASQGSGSPEPPLPPRPKARNNTRESVQEDNELDAAWMMDTPTIV